MRWMQRAFPLAPGDTVLQRTPAGFDAAVWEFFAPALAGACLVLGDPDAHRDPRVLAQQLARDAITVVQVVPSLLRLLLDEPALTSCTRLRRIFAGGERLPAELAARVRALGGPALINLYGPTEATIDATFHVAGDDAGHGVPIGRPVDHVIVRVLDADLHPVPPGVPGELYLGGIGLARGYLGRPDLTAERFLPDPWSGSAGARLYRTGDRVRMRDDGALEYLGRRDGQIKLRGQRIELGEVEAALAAHPAVKEAVAASHGEGGDAQLIAYVVPRAGEQVDVRAVQAFLRDRVPAALVPAEILTLEALPRTAGGKLDRRALPAPVRGLAHDVGPGPRTETERRLVEIWAEVLEMPAVGIDDNFFDLGGHSLLAVQIASRIRNIFAVDVPLRALFEAPTVAGLAAWLATAPAASVAPAAIPVAAHEEQLLQQLDDLSPEALDALLQEYGEPK
jgi:acyl-coenzyme A synthetase/AMP-(fatty) acid ligase/acyl carrier protein